MTYIPIVPGSANWDVPLNAALVDQDARITANSSDVSGKVSKAGDTMTGTLVNDNVSANGTAYLSRQTADAVDRFRIQNSGRQEWGDGAATRDVSLARASTGQLRVTPTANTSASTSAGGALNVTAGASNGAGLVVYNDQATPLGHNLVSRVNSATFDQNGIFAQYNGTGHNVNISHAGTGASSSGLNVGSTNTAHSAVGISGVETAKGTVKITHTGTGADASAAAISIDLAGTGTAAQGIFITGTNGGTTGALIEARNGGTGAVFNVSSTGAVGLGSGTGAPDTSVSRSGANAIAVGTADLRVATAGRGLRVAEGANAKQGTATLVGGTVVVGNTSVTANSRIFLTSQVDGGTPGFLRVAARTAATSFTILSSSGTDTSTVAWEIFEPA